MVKNSKDREVGQEGLNEANLSELRQEVRRIFWQLVWHKPPTVAEVLAWSRWRGLHQAPARHGP